MAELAVMSATPDPIEKSSEALIEAKIIGKKIRALRLKHSMGLVELGKRVGLSPSFLSQLETGRVVPTLRNLARIALVFREELSYFFQTEQSHFFRRSRPKDRVRIPIVGKGVPFLISESLGSIIPDQRIAPGIADFLPGIDGAALDPHMFEGLECVYVINGGLTALVNGKLHVLESGDILWIDGSAKRQYRCHGDNAAKALIITIPKLSMDQFKPQRRTLAIER